MKNSKYMGCDFCGFKLEKVRSNNGRCLAKIIGKDEMRICSFCNELEVNIRIYGNTLFFYQGYDAQHPVAKLAIDNRGYYNTIVKYFGENK